MYNDIEKIENIIKQFNHNSLDGYYEIVGNISNAMKKGQLVFFIGAGISRIQGYPGWDDYINKLLIYWESHITDANTPADMVNINVIDRLLKSNISNKRKVDLLHTLLRSVFGADGFAKKQYEFERLFFEQMIPLTTNNEVLSNLTKLDAFFLTTNYDHQIEENLYRYKHVKKYFLDYEEFEKSVNNIPLNSVIHMHGTPSGNPDYFISSSSSYKKLYLGNNQMTQSLKCWISDDDKLLVFIGSSMEEDEVVSLLDTNRLGQHHIAFLLSDDGTDKVGNNVRDLHERYHSKENHTKIFWYGDKYEDLPVFINKLVNDVQQQAYPESTIPQSNDDFTDMRRESTNSNRVSEILKKTDIQTISTYIKDLPENVSQNRTELLIDSAILNQTNILIPKEFWELFISNAKMLSESSERIDNIIEIVKNNRFAFRDPLVYKLFYEKIKIKNEIKEKFDKMLGEKPDVIYTDFSKVPEIMGWSLVYRIKSDTFNRSSAATHDVLYNLVNDAVSDLIGYFIPENKLIQSDYSIEMLLNEEPFGLLYTLFKDNNLKIDGQPWQDEIPNELLAHPIFIKILSHLDLEKDIDQKLITRIIQNVNIEVLNYGREFGEFYEKHSDVFKQVYPDLIRPNYKDDIFDWSINDVTNYSLLDQTDIIKNENIILEKLLNKPDDYLGLSEKLGNSFLLYEDTNKYLIKIIDYNNDISKKFINLLSTSAQFNKLFDRYKPTYIVLAKKDNDNDSLINKILAYYTDDGKTIFDLNDQKLFDLLLNKVTYQNNAAETLLNMDISNIKDDLQDIDEFNLQTFINTNLGRYLELYSKIVQINDKYKDKITTNINNLDNIKIKEFMIGRHFNLFDIEDKQKTIYELKGFSSLYRLPIGKTESFKEAVKYILNNSIDQDFIRFNVTVVALEQINPKELSVSNWEDINYFMLDFIFDNDYSFKFKEEWLNYISKNASKKFVNHLMVKIADNKKIVRENVRWVFKKLPLMSRSFSKNIQLFFLRNKYEDLLDVESKKYFIKLCNEVLINNKVKKQNFDNESIELIFNESGREDRLKLMEPLKEIMSPLDYSQLISENSLDN